MDFQTVLREVVEETDGGLATLLMDFEGIPVDSYSKPEAPFEPSGFHHRGASHGGLKSTANEDRDSLIQRPARGRAPQGR